MLNFSTIVLVGCWLMLVDATLEYKLSLYSSVILMLVMLRWRQHHIVNQALVYTQLVPN